MPIAENSLAFEGLIQHGKGCNHEDYLEVFLKVRIFGCLQLRREQRSTSASRFGGSLATAIGRPRHPARATNGNAKRSTAGKIYSVLRFSKQTPSTGIAMFNLNRTVSSFLY
ncbi:hypothetical protein Avi_0421 [Allorhizobium ampelinum S4]|uniref:Uncharacterized protein n=1 Tax=Allorhizobium ampelinum (strain ATCC BAA-846 / DSM 112012 / S4) TaxID=311402 RepID=B9JZH9_ALLAM|nr:hypothetical protein Avi_0421 [Allorhizobium ampelinum S4]